MQTKSLPKSHRHMWIVGIVGLLAGLVLMVYVPSLKAVSSSLLLFAGFHLIGAAVALVSILITFGRIPRWPIIRQLRRAESRLDFGWAPAWTLGPLLASIVFATAAVAVQAQLPQWWPLSYVLLFLSASSFAGFRFTLATTDPDFAPLPMVNLLPGGRGVILDGGCGAGRTSLAVAKALPEASLVALDRFDSNYIENGGRQLAEMNFQIAGIDGRARTVKGDLTALPFEGQTFDAIVSAHAMDHLGNATETGLAQIWRVLKPGRHFLLVVWVPGWTMFAVANVLSFMLAGKASWRTLTRRTGFELLEEGSVNGYWYLLLKRPDRSGLGTCSN